MCATIIITPSLLSAFAKFSIVGWLATRRLVRPPAPTQIPKEKVQSKEILIHIARRVYTKTIIHVNPPHALGFVCPSPLATSFGCAKMHANRVFVNWPWATKCEHCAHLMLACSSLVIAIITSCTYNARHNNNATTYHLPLPVHTQSIAAVLYCVFASSIPLLVSKTRYTANPCSRSRINNWT